MNTLNINCFHSAYLHYHYSRYITNNTHIHHTTDYASYIKNYYFSKVNNFAVQKNVTILCLFDYMSLSLYTTNRAVKVETLS